VLAVNNLLEIRLLGTHATCMTQQGARIRPQQRAKTSLAGVVRRTRRRRPTLYRREVYGRRFGVGPNQRRCQRLPLVDFLYKMLLLQMAPT